MSTTCPTWCNSPHRNDWDAESHDGPVWPNIASVDGNGDDCVQIGTRYHPQAGIVVTLEAQSLILTPEQARGAALALLEAASWAKDHRVSQDTRAPSLVRLGAVLLGRSRRIAFVLRAASRVLTSTAHSSGRPFGTKRP